jgi:hypothetical protein
VIVSQLKRRVFRVPQGLELFTLSEHNDHSLHHRLHSHSFFWTWRENATQEWLGWVRPGEPGWGIVCFLPVQPAAVLWSSGFIVLCLRSSEASGNLGVWGTVEVKRPQSREPCEPGWSPALRINDNLLIKWSICKYFAVEIHSTSAFCREGGREGGRAGVGGAWLLKHAQVSSCQCWLLITACGGKVWLCPPPRSRPGFSTPFWRIILLGCLSLGAYIWLALEGSSFLPPSLPSLHCPVFLVAWICCWEGFSKPAIKIPKNPHRHVRRIRTSQYGLFLLGSEEGWRSKLDFVLQKWDPH